MTKKKRIRDETYKKRAQKKNTIKDIKVSNYKHSKQ